MPTEIRKGKRVLKLSNLDKPFWPEEGITKGDLLAYYRDVAPVARSAPQRPAVHDEALSRRVAGQVLLPEGRAEAHARLDPDAPIAVTTREKPRQKRRIDCAARQRRARAAVDGEHGLHRHERVVLAGRQARAARLRALRPRPVARRRVRGDGRGRAAREAGARRARARELPEDERRATGSTSSSRSRGATRTTTRASSRRSSPARSRGRIAGW